MEQLLQSERDGACNWEKLADELLAAGLTASALSALDMVIDNEKDLYARAISYDRMGEVEHKLNMEWAAAADHRVANRLRGIPNPQAPYLELDDGELTVLSAHNNPEIFERIMASLPNSPLLNDPMRDPTLSKRAAMEVPKPGHGPATDDCSFFVLDLDDRPILQVEADVTGDRFLGCRQTAILLTKVAPDHPQIPQAENLAVRQLIVALEWSGCKNAVFEMYPPDTLPPILHKWVTNSGIRTIPLTAAWIDLSLDAEEIERRYRSAHRQSLRWGRNNMRVAKTSTPDPVLLGYYQQVHDELHRIPGLPVESVIRYLDEGRLNLYIGFYEDKPVVALLSSRHGTTTYYAASAKIPIGNKPLGHVVLHQAIMDAKAEGQKRFDFGGLNTDKYFSEKLRGIALYKSGFATHTQNYVHYLVKL